MCRHRLTCVGPRLGMFPVAVFVCAVAMGGAPDRAASQNSSASQREGVELFAAIDQGQIEATFIAQDAQ